MFSSRALVSVLLIALFAVDAHPLHDSRAKVPISPRMGNASFKNIIASDKARINAMKQSGSHGKRSHSDVDLSDVDTYSCFTVQVGTAPGTLYKLAVDTGSSLTWIGSNTSNPYQPSSSGVNTGVQLKVNYGIGSFVGEEYRDTLTFSSGLTVESQGIGSASESQTFDIVDGILGLGPVGLTSAYTHDKSHIATVTDNLYSQNVIGGNLIGVYVSPLSAETQTVGELSFGGIDSSKITGDVNYVSLTQANPASEYWGIDLSVKYGAKPILSPTSGVVDTGTTLIYLSSDAFAQYQAATGGVQDPFSNLLQITSDQYNNLQTLTFTIGNQNYDFSPNAQIWPRSLNTQMGGSSDGIYLIVFDGGSSGLDVILGFGFMQRYYIVYDTSNKQVGFGRTQYTDAKSN